MSIEVSYLVHATEDQEKIQRSIEGIIGTHARPELELMEGHFGNEITRARIHLTGEAAWDALRSIVVKLSPDGAKELSLNTESYLDEHSAMFLRFDKQALVAGSLVFGSVDPVRMKVKPRGYMIRGDAASFFRNLIQGG